MINIFFSSKCCYDISKYLESSQKIFSMHNIFLSQYREQKCLVCNGPNIDFCCSNTKKIIWGTILSRLKITGTVFFFCCWWLERIFPEWNKSEYIILFCRTAVFLKINFSYWSWFNGTYKSFCMVVICLFKMRFFLSLLCVVLVKYKIYGNH